MPGEQPTADEPIENDNDKYGMGGVILSHTYIYRVKGLPNIKKSYQKGDCTDETCHHHQ